MKCKAAYLMLMLVGPLLAQNNRSGKATSTGQCSVAHSGNYDTIIIKNCGIGEEQGKKIESLLYEVLHDKGDTSARLDELLRLAREGQGRSLSSYQLESIGKYLQSVSPKGFYGINTYTSDRESLLYGNQFVDVFAANKWRGQGLQMVSHSSPPFGISVLANTLDSHDSDSSASKMLIFLRSIGIECEFASTTAQKGEYAIQVGLKPVKR